MSTELTPLKVLIGMDESTGHHAYPAFDSLPVVQASNLTWTKWVDVHGDGWHYDKKAGHKEVLPDSPQGTWIGVLLVPDVFAQQAVSMFPAKCSIMGEVAWEDFYDNRAHLKEPEERFDQGVLDGLVAKKALGLTLTPQQQDALDPKKHDVPGIIENKRRKWKSYKQENDFSIKK